ncbi:hypothetical protein CRG98_021767 [Punica granatum]|uniref:Extensin-like n=1 Tax=Punica granatum TaxID=22663 RepID=A0A2I0JPM0_PUNGR|nr:hypothetical protein CRG98_021767 [Punica granatum]
MRGSPHLLQIWLLAHIRPFCSSHLFSYITDERSPIERLVLVIPPPEHSFSEWRHFWRELTPARFLWVARWNPGGPMITGCPRIVGVPLLSHLGSTLILPGQIREIHRQRDASTIQRLYFPEHPTDEERAFSATSAYVAQFYSQGSASPQRSQATPTPQAAPTPAHEAESSTQAVIATGVAPLPDSSASQDGGRGSSRYLRRSQPTGFGSFSTTSDARSAASNSCRHTPGVFGRPSGTSPAPDVFKSVPSTGLTDVIRLRRPTRITALEGTVNQLAASMAADIAELFALLRGPNRASSSSTPPPGQGPMVDRTPWVPPTQVPENIDAPAPPTLHTSTVHPFTSPFPPPPAPTAVPLPPATFLSSEHAPSAPPPISIPAPSAVYAVPSPMVFPASCALALTHLQTAELPPYPSLQPQRMEETIRALQASDARPDAHYGDCSLFPGMRLPPKFKIPEFKTYEGTTDPRHHLHHYRGKMLLSAPHFGPPASYTRIPDQSPGTPQSLTDAFSDRAPGARFTDKRTAPQNGPTGTQGPAGLGNKLQITFRSSARFPEGRFSSHERLPTSLRGTSTKKRDHNDPRAPHNEPRAPQDIQGPLRKPRSKPLGLPGPTVFGRGRRANDPPQGIRATETNVRMRKEQSGTEGH